MNLLNDEICTQGLMNILYSRYHVIPIMVKEQTFTYGNKRGRMSTRLSQFVLENIDENLGVTDTMYETLLQEGAADIFNSFPNQKIFFWYASLVSARLTSITGESDGHVRVGLKMCFTIESELQDN